jgi:glucan phosphoethanolaminetransferase (alkaline phosphatase superfamily)
VAGRSQARAFVRGVIAFKLRKMHMAEKYQCTVCAKTFKTSEAVDGFAQGFKTGFLCPFCKCNLVESGDYSSSLFNLRFGLRYAALMFLAFFAIHRDLNVLISSGVVSTKLIVLAGLMGLATAFLFYINRAVLFKETIIYTKRVMPRNGL